MSKLKWLEPRHMVNIENRWSRDRTNDLQYMFFNGIGYTAWENVWGIWNQLTPRDAEALRRIATIAAAVRSRSWSARTGQPYEKTLQAGVFASRFPGDGRDAVDDRESQRIRSERRAVRARARAGHAATSTSGTACGWSRGSTDGRRALSLTLEAQRLRRGARRRRRRGARRTRRVPRADAQARAHAAAARSPTNGGRCRSRWSRSRNDARVAERAGRHGRDPRRRSSISRSAASRSKARPGTASTSSIRGRTVRARAHHRHAMQIKRFPHRPLSGHERAVQEVPRRERLSAERRPQLPARLGRTARRRAAGRTSRSRGCRSKTRAPTRTGRASGCRTNGNGSTPRRALTVVATRGATTGTREACPRTTRRA